MFTGLAREPYWTIALDSIVDHGTGSVVFTWVAGAIVNFNFAALTSKPHSTQTGLSPRRLVSTGSVIITRLSLTQIHRYIARLANEATRAYAVEGIHQIDAST